MSAVTMAPVGATPVQKLVGRVSRTVGIFRGRPRHGLRVLLYHAVGSDVPDDNYGMSVTPQAFAQQMRWLREESGCSITSLEAGVAALAGGTLTGTAVAVTFDDGFRDVQSKAAPVLAEYQIPFTVFVIASHLVQPPPLLYLDLMAVRELAAMPYASIGAHGFTHRPLTRLTGDSLDEDLRRSREVFAESLGTATTTIAYPHGAVDRRVIGRVEAAGFRIGATSFVGVNQSDVSPLQLRRTEILAHDSLAEFSGKVRGDYDWYHVRQRMYWPLPPHQ